VLLSNGNAVGSANWRRAPLGRWTTLRQACYLFALVAGDLACVGHFRTAAGAT
jgi:aminopeptidase N